MKDINATVIVDLKPKEEEILQKLNKDARWGINKAKKEGLIVEETNRQEDWLDFYKIYKEAIIYGGANPETLDDLKKKARNFFICKLNNKIIAGAGIEFSDFYNINIPRLYFNASLKEYQTFQPNNLLYWHCILWCKKNNYKEFDLGGWQIKARGHLIGVNKFKEKWGNIVYYYKNYSLTEAIGRKLIRNFNFFWWLNRKLKRRK